MRIAIDGPAASGKTSVGRALARRFGLRFVETGRMYRAVALGLARGKGLGEIDVTVTVDERILLNGEDVTDALHTPTLDQASSQVATRADVRERMVAAQRALARSEGVVMEGRDIGTVVLPDAEVKLFLQASPETRAERRAAERGEDDIEETLVELRVRDERDSTRAIAPLNAAWDAITIHTDRKTLEAVIREAVDLVKERLEERCHGYEAS
ncbi:MAG: (d)CMP kinase [Candidatus Bipolaricaulota bacterium]